MVTTPTSSAWLQPAAATPFRTAVARDRLLDRVSRPTMTWAGADSGTENLLQEREELIKCYPYLIRNNII